MNEDVIARMRDRVRQLRKVLALAHDRRMIEIIQKVIEEGEADIRKLEAPTEAERPIEPPLE